MQAVSHQSIEVRAYELWEAAGRPFGRSEEFWFQASTELAVKETRPPRKAKVKAAATAMDATVAQPAVKAKKKAAAPSKAAARKSK